MADLPHIDNLTARRLFLGRHGLAGQPRRRLDRAGLAALIDRLGFVQIDSINTVARAHDLILFSRADGYRPGDLKRLAERDRALFEHWTHDAAFIPMRFYPYWRRRFAESRARLSERWRKWQGDGFEARFAPVLAHIGQHGPARAREVRGDGDASPSGGWWDWHPSKTALEYLWRTGDIAVAGRDGFQKIYDLADRVIPAAVRGRHAADAEIVDWACAAALERLGFATPGELAAFWDLVTIEEAKRWCAARLARPDDADGLREVAIEPAGGGRARTAVAAPGLLEAAPQARPAPAGIRVLSPFDPLLRDRRRALRLFGFDYRIEVFVPEPKRRYGYYVFPLLEGDRLVGRIDMRRADAGSALGVRRVWWEPGIRAGRGRLGALEVGLDRVRRFAGCERLGFDDGWRGDG